MMYTYRSTTLKSTDHSPSEVVLNRRIKIALLMLSKNNEPRLCVDDEMKAKHKASLMRNEFHNNKRYSPRSLPILEKGDQVRIKTDKDDARGKASTRSWNSKDTSILWRTNRAGDAFHEFHETKEKNVTKIKMKYLGAITKLQRRKAPMTHWRNAETIPTHLVQNRIVPRSEGVRTRSGSQGIPPDRLNLWNIRTLKQVNIRIFRRKCWTFEWKKHLKTSLKK